MIVAPHGVIADGNWTYSTYTSSGALFGANHRLQVSPPPAGESFTWAASVGGAGRYRIYARWGVNSLTSTDQAIYTVHHAAGTTPITVNQIYNGGKWNLLGTFDLPAAGGKVVLTNANGSKLASADAVMFVREFSASGAEEVVVDNASAVVVGAWTTSAASGANYEGTNYLTAAPGDGSKTVTWTPALTGVSLYRVYVKYPPSFIWNTNVTYTVFHDGGATPVSRSQAQNGGSWVQLGTFAMTPGQNHGVRLTNQGSGGYNIAADAALFVPIGASDEQDIVVDNGSAGTAFSGAWVNWTYQQGGQYWNTNYMRQNAPSPSDWYSWTPTLPRGGYYRVSARWVEYSTYAAAATYSVTHADGETAFSVNQRTSGGRWMELGTFRMAPGQNHRVVLSNTGTDYAVADAIRFEYVGPSPVVMADAVRFVANDGSALAYVHADHLGTPVKMTDPAKAVVWDLVRRPFGDDESLAGAALLEVRFPGQWRDAATDRGLPLTSALRYNYMRDYDPVTGRYLQPDPIGLAGGRNVYGYVGGNPVNFVDPTGENPILIAMASGALLGGGLDIALQLYDNGGRWGCLDWHSVGFQAGVGALTGGWGAALNGLTKSVQYGVIVTEEAATAAEGTLSRASSLYDTSITRAGSQYLNVQTDVGAAEFQQNLMSNGYSVVKQAQGATVFSNGTNTWTIYARTSTGAPGAQFFGGNGSIVKYSLGGP